MENGYQSIGDIIEYFKGKKIVIPDYQRGYRWEADQVKKLLEDIFEYYEDVKNASSYCIQPLVVSEKGINFADNKESCINVIDGQQRLTTISLLLEEIKSRVDGVGGVPIKVPQIELIYPSKKNNILDKRYRENAKLVIQNWIKNKTDYEKLVDLLLEKTQFIWYAVDMGEEGQKETSEQKVFENFNRGKIALTDAELIKAQLMNPDNYKNQYEVIKDRQILISTSWDIIEKKLHDDETWAFFPHRKDYNSDTRIDSLFELYLRMEGKIPDGESMLAERKLYDKFYELIGLKEKDIFGLWQKVTDLFDFCMSLFEDNEFYNLYSLLTKFLSDNGENVYIYSKELISKLQGLDVSARKGELKERIWKEFSGKFIQGQELKRAVESELVKITYADKRVVSTMMLFAIAQLHNVTSISGEKVSSSGPRTGAQIVSRFPFYFYFRHKEGNKEYWEKEHIFAKKEEYLDFKNWTNKSEEKFWEKIGKYLDYCTIDIKENPPFMKYVNKMWGMPENAIPHALSTEEKPEKNAPYEYNDCSTFDESKMTDYLKHNDGWHNDVKRYLQLWKRGGELKTLYGYRQEILKEDGFKNWAESIKGNIDETMKWVTEGLLKEIGKEEEIGKKDLIDYIGECANNPTEYQQKQNYESIILRLMEEYIKSFFKKSEEKKSDDGDEEDKFTYTTLVADNYIANLTILPQPVNGSISNGSLAEKKKSIYTDHSGVYIPQTSLQIYTGKYDDSEFANEQWLFEERLQYLDDMVKTIAKFFEG